MRKYLLLEKAENNDETINIFLVCVENRTNNSNVIPRKEYLGYIPNNVYMNVSHVFVAILSLRQFNFVANHIFQFSLLSVKVWINF